MRENLLRPEPTLLPPDPGAALLDEGAAPVEAARRYPTSSLAWALLAEEALAEGEEVRAYAYARTGYHRGLDALRRAGWRGAGPVPFEHTPNQGFLRALMALGKAAGAIGEDDEASRIAEFLTDADPSLSTGDEH
ncbi:hypothetical protein BSZ39_10435 [Bowdeniella nasicola]|uniref:DUF3151 domain-containing protein n=1 Tax=Bowdeniella nasicola TaxID=208480 RepID=A0A1Q5Q064_9ACTO|nr:DUF3151 domain-containing protein [Bowdeniella nasicola]OKL53263.1 hypothetical protein BSZ39_10435 [Bowdeniella nasicola]